MTLPANEVHLWYMLSEDVCSSSATDAYCALMAPEEQRRYDQYLSASARLQFLITRGLVRTVLSRYVAVPPSVWAFRARAHGKPEIAWPREADWLSFNLSNTEGLVVCAVTRGRDLGVDAEAIRPAVKAIEVADRYLSPVEMAALRALPAAARGDRFVAYWTLKEAYIKARGCGLSLPLDKFSIQFAPDGAITITADPAIATVSRWRFFQFRPTASHLVAVAVSDRRSDGEAVSASTELKVMRVIAYV
jgi:4'-phosphopantetheinyl transferase